MKWDDRYEHIQIGFKDNTMQIARGVNKEKCVICKKKTYWIYFCPASLMGGKITYNNYICSEECLEKIKKA